MKKTMSLVLALLMLASILASINPIELSKEEVVDDAEGRAAYEVVLVGAMEPRASSTDMNGNVRNALEVGEEINFRVVVENTGDNDVPELSITIQVDDGVEVTPLLIDAEDSAVCDDTLSCDHASLAAGDYLAGGNYFVRDGVGGNLAWTPDAPGVFTVTITINGGEYDTNLNNNQVSYDVTVIDWYDISVSLAWDDEVNGGSGAGPHLFTMTALVDGSDSWEPRNVEMEVGFAGLFEAFDGDGATMSSFDGQGCNDPNDCTFSVTFGDLRGAGQSEDIEVYANLTSEPPTFTNASDLSETRLVPAFQTAYTFGGSIKGDATTANGIGIFTITASLKNYIIFEQVSTDYGAGPGAHESDIVTEMVETNQSLDDRNGNNDALLTGTFASYHDVRVIDVEVGPDRADGGRLDAGLTRLYATVQHSGSNPESTNYDWAVTFTVTDDLGQGMPYVSNACEDEELNPYSHAALGEMLPAILEGTACVDVMLNPGVYSITAQIEMLDTELDNGNYTDMNSANDRKTGHFEVINYGPFAYLSMDEVSGALVLGDQVSFSARAMHQNQPDMDGDGVADPMSYSWSYIGSTPEPDPQLDGCMMSDICTINLGPAWSGSPTIIVTVTDHWMATAVAQVQFTVYNEFTTEDNVGDCYDIDYSLIFGGQMPMAANFTDADDALDQTLPGSPAAWNSVCTFNIEVAAQLSPGDVFSEDLTVAFDSDPADGYSLWFEGATGWVELAGTTQTQVDADTVSLSWSNDGSLGSRSSSRYAVFASATLGQAPQSGISGLSAALSAGGVVTLTWDVENEALNADGDFGAIYINSDGAALDGDRNTFPLAQKTWEIAGIHGTTYNYLVRVENGEVASDGSSLFGTPVDSGSATADGQVDPAPGTSDITANHDGTNISFTWTAADPTDVSHWSICWSQAGAHTALEVTTNLINTANCYNTEDSTTSATMARHVSAGNYFYSVNAIDGVGNIAPSDSSDALNFASDSGTLPGDGDIVGEEPSDKGIPQQAWIAIGLLVLVAVIAGAFILTRGGAEGGDDEFDY
jgi:hypothetical protein